VPWALAAEGADPRPSRVILSVVIPLHRVFRAANWYPIGTLAAPDSHGSPVSTGRRR